MSTPLALQSKYGRLGVSLGAKNSSFEASTYCLNLTPESTGWKSPKKRFKERYHTASSDTSHCLR
jgi:hypothetical protein